MTSEVAEKIKNDLISNMKNLIDFKIFIKIYPLPVLDSINIDIIPNISRSTTTGTWASHRGCNVPIGDIMLLEILPE